MNNILAKIETLPPMPGVAVQLLSALETPHIDLMTVARWVEQDPSITANLLRICNSPYYGLKRQITSVPQAANILGSKQLAQIALTTLSSRYLSASLPGYSLAAGDLWRQSLAAAIACELLAARTPGANAATAYTAGLLQDIGKVVLAEFVAESQTKMRALLDHECLDFEAAERQVLGTSHAEVGAHLLARWAFPERLVESVQFHHEPAGAIFYPELVRLSHRAAVVSLTTVRAMGEAGRACRFDEETASTLGFTSPEQLQAIVDQVVLRLEKAEALFG